MNKIFKVIWNHATQSWVAVSEFTKAHGKTKSVKLSAVATAIAAAATVGGTAHAAVSIGTTTGTTIATEAGGAASAGISIGEGASTEAANDIAIGQGATIDRGDPNSPVGSIVIGNKAESTGQFGDIVIGAFSKTGKALGHPGNPSQITVIGSRSFAYGNQASVLSSDAVATGSSSISMGGDDINDARVALDRDIAEFTAANVKAIKNNYEFIWGLVDPTLTATLKNTKIDMAGYGGVNPELKDTAAANLNDTHFLRTWAAGDASIALGYAAQTLGTGSHAIGINAVAYSTASNAIGVLSRAGDKTNVAGSANANAFGTAAVAAAKDANAIGHNATVKSGAEGAIAFGVNASATAARNVVIGSNSSELSSTNTVGGQGNKIDSGVVGGVPYSGFAGEDKLVGVVSVGNGDQTRQIINVAPGAITAESTDAINGSQLYQVLKPITFTANSNKDAAVTDNGANFAANDGAQIPLNETLNIIGATASKDLSLNSDAAVDGTYSAKNIQTVVTTNNQLQIQMAENPQFKSVQLDEEQIPASADATKADAPAFPNGGKNAISANDLMNTGWNLQANDTAVDLVNPYNTVNFKGEGVTITPETDGNVSTLTFKVEQPTAGTFKADENGSVAPTDGEGDKFASVQGVADAVNNSYWNINTSQDGAGEAKVGDGKVNPSNDVVINGKDAVKVTAGTSTDNKYVIDIAVEADGSTVEIKDGKITAKTAPLAAEPVADLTAPTAGKIAAPTGDAGNALTTAANVAEMINAAAWKATSAATAAGENTGTSVELVQAGDTVTFEADSGVKIAQSGEKFTFSVKTDNTTTRINDKGEIEAIAPETATVTNVAEGQDQAGSVTAPATPEEGAKLVTAQTLADAINNSGFTLKASAAEGTEDGSTVEQDLIKAGETVEMIAGKNLNVKQEADGKVTYSTKENVEFTEIKVAAPNNIATNPITIGTNPAGENVISGLSNTLAPLNVNPAETKAPTFDDAKLGSAATLSDVLNAGWNLQNNSEAKDFVKAYDTVNFVDGQGTKAVVDVKADGTIADVKFDVDVTQLSAPITNNEDGSLAGPTNNPALQTALTEAQDALNALPQDATPEARKEAEDKVAAAQNAINNAGNQLATAQNVADSVNNSFWNINTSQDGANEAKVGDGKVNPSNNVVFNGVGAVKVAAGTTDEGKYTVDFSVETDDTTVEVKDGKIAAKTSTLAAAPTDNPAAPTAGTITAGDAPTALTTAQNVADMINAAAWKATSAATAAGTNEGTSVELVNAGDTVTFEADSGVKIVQDAGKFTFSVKTDGKTTKINDAGEIEAIAPETATVTNVEEGQPDAGSVTAPATPEEGAKLVTAQTLADAINKSGFTLKHSVTDGEDLGGNEELINPGDVVEMIAGKNLSVKQEADGKITYATKENVEFTEIKVAAPKADGSTGDNPITIANNAITGLNSTLPETVNGAAPTTSQAAPTLAPADLTKAATVGDVLNAGWNLKANNADVDFVKPYDTVNFVDGKGTKVVTSTDSETSNVQIDVDVTQLSAPITNNADGSVTGPANSTELADAVKAAEDALAALPADATPEEKAAAEKAVQDAKDAVTNAGNALATAQNVADAINASGWNVTSGKVGTGEVEGTTNELINPSETVTFQAGDNMMLKQEGNVFTYSVNPNPVFNNVTANQVTVGGTPATQDAPAKAPIVIGTNPEGKNEITGLDTTLPVPAAEQAKPADINESKAATLGDVLNAGWNLKNNGEAKDVVTPYDTVDFVDGNGTKVSIDTVDGVSTVKVDIDPTQIAAPVTNVVEGDQAGSVTGPTTAAEEALKAAQDELAALPADASEEAKQAAADKVAAAQNAVNNAGNQLATAQNVANAINNSGWKATSGTVGTGTRDGADATVELINPSETVTFNAGDNLVIEQAGNAFTYSLNKDIAINSAKIGNADAPITIGTDAAGNNVIDGLTTTIAAPTTEVKPADKPTADKLDNAATLGDVLNAGWNLQENGTAKDVVTPYDTVNFANGTGTTVNITSDGATSVVKVDVAVDDTTVKIVDGKLTAVQPDTLVNGNKVGGNVNFVDSDTVTAAPGDNPGDIKFNVNTASITPVTEGDKAGSVTGPVTPALADALKAAQDELAALPADASEEVKQAAADKVAAAQNAVNKAGNAVATAQNVADAINASGWNATSGAVGTGKVEGTTKELINPSETVTFQAGDNMMLKQEGNVFTYSVNPNPVFNNVTAEAGVTIGKGDQAVNMTPIAPVNVLDKDGNIVGNSTAPAVNMNGATFTGLAPNLPVTSSVKDGDISPTTSQTIDPSKVNQSNAATLGDVLNTGWNLQANDKAVDFVRPYDTVNFKDSDSIKVSVAEDSTAAKTTLTLEANTSPLVMNGATADNEGGNGTVATPANPKALATSGDVAKAINNSGFDLDVGSDTTTNGQVVSNDAAAARVNPGKKVTVNAGRNIEVSRKGSDITVATSNDPVFNTVKVGGDDGVQLSASTGRDGVKELSVGSANAPTRITNVAKGVAPTDAVNVAQLKDEIGAAVAPIHNRINKVNKDLRAGIAGANAAAGLPQVYIPGKSMVAASAGTFKGQSAVAVGYSRASDNGKLILKLQGNANTRGDVGGSVGVGYQW